jgi:hypothetical protein
VKLLFKVLFCVFIGGTTMFVYISRLNEITKLRLEIPTLEKKLKGIVEENHHLSYEIDRFENPLHLMEFLRRPEYGHLRHPTVEEVVTIE